MAASLPGYRRVELACSWMLELRVVFSKSNGVFEFTVPKRTRSIDDDRFHSARVARIEMGLWFTRVDLGKPSRLEVGG
jgi:hypothetical protein